MMKNAQKRKKKEKRFIKLTLKTSTEPITSFCELNVALYPTIKQTIVSEFDSHWVPYTSGFVPQLS